jgi:hypothetical protein
LTIADTTPSTFYPALDFLAAPARGKPALCLPGRRDISADSPAQPMLFSTQREKAISYYFPIIELLSRASCK